MQKRRSPERQPWKSVSWLTVLSIECQSGNDRFARSIPARLHFTLFVASASFEDDGMITKRLAPEIRARPGALSLQTRLERRETTHVQTTGNRDTDSHPAGTLAWRLWRRWRCQHARARFIGTATLAATTASATTTAAFRQFGVQHRYDHRLWECLHQRREI